MVLFRRKFGVQCGVFAALWFLLTWMREAAALRPLRNRNPSPSAPWTDERIFLRSGGNDPTLFSGWNITGTYRGTWSFRGESNRSSKFLNFGVSNGMSVFQLASIPTKINGVHYVQGAVFFHDGHENDVGIAQMQVEGVYIWPFKQLRLVVSRGSDRELLHAEHYMSNPYHLLEAFSSQVFQDSTWDQAQRKNYGEHYCYHLEGLMESPAVEDDGECFSSIQLHATSINVEIYYSKAVNYTLMVTFVSLTINKFCTYFLFIGKALGFPFGPISHELVFISAKFGK